MASPDSGAVPSAAEDEAAIRGVVKNFEDGWNRRDAGAMVRDMADRHEHVHVGGGLLEDRASMEATYRQLLATVWPDVTYRGEVEKIRFLRHDVAVAIVRATYSLPSGASDTARSTWVLTKDEGRWSCVSFHNTYIKDVPIRPQEA